MELLLTWLAPVTARMESLVPLLVAAMFAGEPLARLLRITALLTYLRRRVAQLGQKLDRPTRSTATRVYRGMVVVLLLLGPALLCSQALLHFTRDQDWIIFLLLVTLFGQTYGSWRDVRHYQAARAGTLTLSIGTWLFADTHAVIRYLIVSGAADFARGVVGGAFWYVLADLPGLVLYLMLAGLATLYTSQAFGWATQGLFALLDAIPRRLTYLLLMLAAFVVPRTHPLVIFRDAPFHGHIARVVGVALGGPSPAGDLPWSGEGTPKPGAEHLARFLLLKFVATVWLLLFLASTHIYNILILFV